MPSPNPTRVLRFERSDEADAFVLIQVSYNGPAPLDLTLTATEGESPYVSLVKQTCLKDFRAKNYHGSDDEWARIVALILGQSSAIDDPDWAAGLEASVTISGSDQDNKELVLTIRKRVETITQRLGALLLRQDDEQSVELFEWTGIATARADMLEQQVTNLTSRCTLAEDTINKLNQQLEELLHAKSQHENQLVANFVQILNEKKLKIRNQQRLLAAATVDPAKVSEIQARIPAESPEGTSKSQPPKRSAGNLSDTESSDGFERMDVDPTKTERGPVDDQETDEGHSTPEPLDEENNSTTDDNSSEDEPAQPTRVTPVQEAAPPQRELPFAKRSGGVTKSTTPATAKEDPEETAGETDDDEL